MSAVSTSRAFGPSAVALVAVLVALLLAPLAMQPTPAQAVNLPDLNPCHLGDLTQKVCNGAEDVAGGVVDGVEWVGDGVGRIAGGVWNASKPFLKAAAAAGLVVGTAVVCSKAAKALAAGSAAVAAGAGSAGTGSAPAAAAALAGTAAMCTLLKNGGKLALKIVGKNSGKLGKLAKLAAAATGLAAVTLGTQHAAAWILQNALDVTAPSAPNLGSSWVADLRSNLNGLAGALLVVAAILGLMFAAFSGRISEVGRILSGMIGAALVIGIVGSLLFTTVQLSDQVTAGTVQSKWGQQALGNWTDLSDSYANASPVEKDDGGAGEETAGTPDDAAETEQAGEGTPPDDGKGPWILRFLIAIVTVFAGALVWLELQIRNALLELLLVFSGLMLAGYAFEKLRHLATSFALTLLGVVVAKPILVVTLLLGGAQMQNAAKTWAILPLLTGAGLMLLAGLMGAKVISWMGFQGALVERGAMRLRSMNGGALRSGGGHGPGGKASDERSEGAPGTPDPTDTAPAARQMTRAAAERATAEAASGAVPGAGAGSGMVSGAAAALDDVDRASPPAPTSTPEGTGDDHAADMNPALGAGADAADDTTAKADTGLQSRAATSDDASRGPQANPSDTTATADPEAVASGRGAESGPANASTLDHANGRDAGAGSDLASAPVPATSEAGVGALKDGAPSMARDGADPGGLLPVAAVSTPVGTASSAATGTTAPPPGPATVGAPPASGAESAHPALGATTAAATTAGVRAEPGTPPVGMTGDHADAIGDQAARTEAPVAAVLAAQPTMGDSDER